jgi:hypothetical protein
LQVPFVSYLFLLPAFRKKFLLRLLVGAIIITMRQNDLSSIHLHASDENLQTYLGFGCRVNGPRFQKKGFDCFWTPMVYDLGANSGEDAVVKRVSRYFQDTKALDWKFPVQRNSGTVDKTAMHWSAES